MHRYAAFEPNPDRLPPYAADCIRPAAAGDAASLLTLSLARDAHPDESPDRGALLQRVEKELRMQADGEAVAVFVAEVDGEVVAFGRSRILTPEESGLPSELPTGWYLTGIIVDPAHRRRGLGEHLTRARIDHIRSCADTVRYVTSKQNRASIALHDRFGFVHVPVEFTYKRARLAYGEGSLYQLAL